MVEAEQSTPTWKFTQCFGDKGEVEDITEADIISTVEFDHTGNYLATGDKGGRVVLFERNETVCCSTSPRLELQACPNSS
jgi:serine/threonine-protein phosphatase 2A regulatory subunit B